MYHGHCSVWSLTVFNTPSRTPATLCFWYSQPPDSSYRTFRCCFPRLFCLRSLYMEWPKLQALVYDILPWRKVPESDARSVGMTVPFQDSLKSNLKTFLSWHVFRSVLLSSSASNLCLLPILSCVLHGQYARVCRCPWVCVCVYARRIVSTDNILRIINTFIFISLATGCPMPEQSVHKYLT